MQHPPPKMISFSLPDPQLAATLPRALWHWRLLWMCLLQPLGLTVRITLGGRSDRHRTPDTPPSPQQKLVANSGNLNKTCWKRINMSTTIQKLLGFMLLFRCVMFAEYTIKTNCNWIIDSYRLWIRTLAFLWNSWDLYIMHGYYVFNKTEHLQTPQTSTIKH